MRASADRVGTRYGTDCAPETVIEIIEDIED